MKGFFVDNHIDKVLEAWKDLQDPKGTLDANTALNTIVNNLQFSENVSKKGLSALDITGKKDDVTITHEIISALAQRFARQEGEVWDDLKNPNGKINSKAAESVLLNEIARKEHLATLGINKNPDILQEASELKSLVSKRHVRDALNVWTDLNNPQGELDAKVARLLIQHSLKEGGVTLTALDTTGKKDEKTMTAEFEKTLSERYVRQAKVVLKDLLDPKGTMSTKEAERAINETLTDGKATLVSLDPSKNMKEITSILKKALTARAARDKKPGELDIDSLIKFVEDLEKPAKALNNDLETPRQFTPAGAPKQVTISTKR